MNGTIFVSEAAGAPPFEDYLQHCQQRAQRALDSALPPFDSELYPPGAGPSLERLLAAMRYSLVNGGKRIRPLLTYAAAEAVAGHAEHPALDGAASAVECIHAYSLVHDDLPAMDDDDLRRGQPSCHRRFDEATAILAGDALQARAFELLAELPGIPASRRIAMLRQLAAAAGTGGMVGGQAIDLGAVDQLVDTPWLEAMHRLKTGALIRAAVALGALAAEATPAQLEALDRYGSAIGLCFQVQDDILDVTGDTHTLGKRAQADQARNKPTYPSLLGLDAARRYAVELHRQALEALQPFDVRGMRLRQLADYILARRH